MLHETLEQLQYVGNHVSHLFYPRTRHQILKAGVNLIYSMMDIR
jgi:hypothetical protein